MLFHLLKRVSSIKSLRCSRLSSRSHLHCLRASSGGTPAERSAQTHTGLGSGPGTCAAFSAHAGTSECQLPVGVRKRRDAYSKLLMNLITMLG